MTQAAAPSFAQLFGTPASVRATAPGRVNLIGEHTDYNGGFVLPAAIPQRTLAELTPAAGDVVDAYSANLPAGARRERFTLGQEALRGTWIDYVQGVTRALAAAGHAIPGFNLRIESEVPLGSGLSSSAALEMSVLRALRDAFALRIDDVQLALLGQRAETDFVGAPIGVMDQMASLFADESHALFLDTRTLGYERVPIPVSAGLIVIGSGVAHSHAAGDYRTRRAECEAAAALLGVPQLRDLSTADLSRLTTLPEPLGRRARHVMTENARVGETVRALRTGDLRAAGVLFGESHASMRDDFDISVPEIDLLVGIAARHPDVYGARLTGGGFGGSIVALARRDACAAGSREIAAEYARRSGKTGAVLVPV